jgi:hypothetical protein
MNTLLDIEEVIDTLLHDLERAKRELMKGIKL